MGGSSGGSVKGQGAGGVDPSQFALAQYNYGEDVLSARSTGAGFGTPTSTMTTQMGEGAANKKALDLAKMSDVNQQLQTQANNQLLNLAGQAAGFGSGGGSFGNTG